MKRLTILLVLLLPCAASAQPAPDMVLLPRTLAEAVRTWIGHPDATTAVQLYAALEACEAANAAHPPARDDCPAVTAALRAQRDAVAEARKTTKPEPVPATP
jgi:hypothetical protein